MNRPPGRGGGLDPEIAARLRAILEAKGAPAIAAKRPEGPGEAKIEARYELVVSGGQRPILVVDERRVVPKEKPGAWGPARIHPKMIDRFADPVDRAIVAAIVEITRQTASAQLKIDDTPTSRFELSRAACARLLPMVGRTDRFTLTTRAGSGGRVRWEDEPWALRLRASEAPRDPALGDAPPAWEVTGVLRAGEIEVPLARLDAYLDGGWAIAGERLARVEDGGASSWLGMLLTHPKLRITPPRRASFLEEIYALPAPPIDLPEGLALPEITAPAMPRLLVHAPPAPGATLFAELGFLYDEVHAPARRPGRVVFDAVNMRLMRRDPALESAALAKLTALGIEPIGKAPRELVPEGAHLSFAAALLPGIVAALVGEGFRVEAGGKTYRRPSEWRMGIRSGVDWLDLEGEVRFGDLSARLPAVLEALRRGEAAVLLDDGTLGLLPETWRARHGLVLRLGSPKNGRLRFTKSQAPLLAALAASEPAVRVDDGFATARALLDREGPIAPEDPPPGFTGTLRGYQRAGLGWLRALSRSGIGGLLADDMGLGKTVQVLALLAERRDRPSLVVAPRSLVFNWKREAARFTPALRVLDHTGGDRRAPGAHFGDHDLVITTYGTLRRDADALATIDFDHVILDEAQAIKNDASETARAARRLRARHRLALSGTPVENHLGELWSIVDFLNPGMLGKATAWRAATADRPSPEAVAMLGRALAPLLLRRTKAEVAPDLPARLEETWIVELSAAERALYEELRARFRAELLTHVRAAGMGAAGTRVLEALLRLRQAACHPGLLDPARRSASSAKLDALVPEIVALRESGQKALVFSQFRSLLDLARPALEAAGIGVVQLDGSTHDRDAVVASFQSDPSIGVMLVSLKAGGVGLNLTAAEYVFLLDPWWNPAAEAQAIDRAHRIGQTKAVFAYRLIAKDTVEERIADLQQKKRALAESVIRGDGAPLRDLTVEDLEALFD